MPTWLDRPQAIPKAICGGAQHAEAGENVAVTDLFRRVFVHQMFLWRVVAVVAVVVYNIFLFIPTWGDDPF